MNNSLLLRLAAITLAFTAVTSAVADQPSVKANDVAGLPIYYLFPIGKVGKWSELNVSTDPSHWRVGRPDGPAATRDQLATVLAQPRDILIGAWGKHARKGQTVYPYGFELGTTSGISEDDKFTAGRTLIATSDEQQIRFDNRGQPASRVAWSRGDTSFAGALAPVLSGVVDDNFVGWLSVPQNDSTEGMTLGGTTLLRLRFRVVNSSLVTLPKQLKGALILLNRDASPSPANQVPPVRRKSFAA